MKKNIVRAAVLALSMYLGVYPVDLGDIAQKLKFIAEKTKHLPPEPVAGYCPTIPVTIPTIEHQPDPDGMNEVILRNAPIFRLHPEEKAMPITLQEYFNSPHTGVEYKHSKDGRIEQLIAPGQVTMEAIWNLVQHAADYADDGIIYFTNPDCVRFGSNPADHRDSNGNLTVPVYALVFECGEDTICINYLTFYGYNSPYEMREPLTGKVLLAGGGVGRGVIDRRDAVDLGFDQNAHDSDLEHFTVVLDRRTLQPIKYYYGSHGRHEGFWMPANHPDVEKEGTHPIAYVAKGGHGIYPMKGIGKNPSIRNGQYIRIFGMANDLISRDGITWKPLIVRIFKSTDPNFDPAIMAPFAWGANKKPNVDRQYSRDGVQGTESQDWYGDVKEDMGRSYDKAPFCADDECKCIYANYAIRNIRKCLPFIPLRLQATIPD